MKFKQIFFIALLILIFNLQIFSQNKGNGLVGKWECVQVTNHITKQIEFLPHGRLVLTTLFIADYTYQVEKNKLITKILSKPAHKIIIDTSTIEVKPDTIIRTQYVKGKKQVSTLIRVGKKTGADTGLLGKWEWKYPTGRNATARFTSDGHMHFKTAINSFAGKYSIHNKFVTIVFSRDRKHKQKIKIWQKKNILIITGSGQKYQALYRRLKE